MQMANLERKNAVRQLAAGIAHEIRNPLTSIKGLLQLAKLRNNPSISAGHIELMLSEIERIEALIGEFQTLARPTQVLAFSVINLGELIRSQILLLEAAAYRRGAIIESELNACRSVYGNEASIKQVVLNLIKNAIEAAGENGEVKVCLNEEAEFAVISVCDNGPGILPEHLKKLGTPFFTTKENGTGLGLAVCYQIIEKHKGKIEAKNQPGRGTCFSAWLPLVKDS